MAQTTTGTWTLQPPQSTQYAVQVQQPINSDGSSVFKSTGVIPIKFTLSAAPAPVLFASMLTGEPVYSALSFTPNPSITVSQLSTLSANYSFTSGNCHGGALRWSVRTPLGSVFIYYGALPNFTDCSGANSQSNVNLLGLSDTRCDTSQVGGTFYDTCAHAMTLVGAQPVQYAALVLDAGWGGDQIVNLSSATVNDNTWTPLSGPVTPTCALPPATIKITQTAGSATGDVDEAESIQPNDSDQNFRVLSCQYIYNLSAKSLPGTGSYKVQAVINGVTAAGDAEFGVK